MNDDNLAVFEKELAALRPREPSARLRARLDALVDTNAGDRLRRDTAAGSSRPAFRWRKRGPWMAIAAGLAFAVGVLWWHPFLPEGNAIISAATPSAEVASVPLRDLGGELAVSRNAYRPLKARNSLRNRIDEGMVTLENGISARQYRFQFVDTVVWENPADGSQFEVSTPREEIVLVPVQTF